MGASRIGVALSDPTGAIVSPLAAIRRTTLDDDLAAIAGLAGEHNASAIVVGLPVSLSGGLGAAGESGARLHQGAIAESSTVPVHSQDERFSTVEAEKTAKGGGTRSIAEQGPAGLRGRLRDTSGVPGRAEQQEMREWSDE